MTAAVPTGIEATTNSATSVLRTLLLCDLVESTALVERLGDQPAAELIRRHDRFARALMLEHGGREIDKTDGFLLMFDRPISAVAFALAYQRGLAELGAQEKVNLAARVGMSERSFARRYRAATGTTPSRAVERLRVEAAREALATSRRQVKDIAWRCGFGSEETMRRSFLRVLSVAPRDYRLRFAA